MSTGVVVDTPGRGLHDITRLVADHVAAAGVTEGLCCVFIQHTSASLTIQESADPSAREDLEAWLDRSVPDGDPAFTHTAEGPDDMPSHVRAMLTDVSLTIPIMHGVLALGTWQGIYLCEHRLHPHRRTIVLSIVTNDATEDSSA